MTKNDDVKLAVPANLAQAVVDYLKARPYEEVYALIAGLLQCGPVESDEQGDK